MFDPSEITEIESKRADAIERHDLSYFFSLFSREFIGTNPFNKVVDKEEVFELFQKGIAGNVSSYKVDIEKISFINSLAVVMGREILRPSASSKTINRRFTNIWLKNGEGWQITVRHASIM
jgi:hypothetical protein